jgi:hypothetical protein
MGLVVQYKCETRSGIVEDYVYFSNIVAFSYQKLTLLKEFPREAYDCVCERSDSKDQSSKVRTYVCFFSEHGLLEVLAESVEQLNNPPPTLTDLFEKLIGNDLV